ncbi:hypothetical protein GGR28_002397 [Lewinella aquimaris]|uniref:Uncharacterized protein n=1 Tax=Neolewinella aquimaris TaxID=1835722 RepID=A0A840E3W5_9BACT|nr:hypothetical protein [Neolewinella aquimaris]MBB4079770.1 hypothetical protein [Neolewinella aquimaris]
MQLLYAFLIILLHLGLTGQTDALLQASTWQEAASGYSLRFTPDGTFEQDYGENARGGRYLMGRYAVDSTGHMLTLSVDYFLGKSRLPGRYRRGQDFYLDFTIDTLTATRLVLIDRLTDELRTFTAVPHDREDPARRRIPKPELGKLKLPEGWGQ